MHACGTLLLRRSTKHWRTQWRPEALTSGKFMQNIKHLFAESKKVCAARMRSTDKFGRFFIVLTAENFPTRALVSTCTVFENVN